MTKILVIEDERDIRENIAEILSLHEIESVKAENGRIGVQMAEEHRPDLILCDVRMPELDGFGTIMELKSKGATAQIPFIFLTALTERESMRYAMKLGADDFITKPFTADELLSAITTQLEKRAALIGEYEEKLTHIQGLVSHSLPHELRTPLTAIMGYSELMLSYGSALTGTDALEMTRHIKRSGERLLRLVENSLLATQLEARTTDAEDLKTLRSLKTDQPDQIVQDVSLEIAEAAKRPDDLELLMTDLPSVRMSDGDFRKLCYELIDNAFKFSTPDSLVTIGTEMLDHQIQVQITDRGRGFDTGQLEQIGAYKQFDRNIYEQQGLGLGLSIAKSLTELYGGEFDMQSKINEYTVVTVLLNS